MRKKHYQFLFSYGQQRSCLNMSNIRDRTAPDLSKLPVTINITSIRELFRDPELAAKCILIGVMLIYTGSISLINFIQFPEDPTWVDQIEGFSYFLEDYSWVDWFRNITVGIILGLVGSLPILKALTSRSITSLHAEFIHRIEKRYFSPDQEWIESISRYTEVELRYHDKESNGMCTVKLKHKNPKMDVILWEPAKEISSEQGARAFWETASKVLKLPKRSCNV